MVKPNPRLDDFQRRHSWAGLPLAVVYKFTDDQGSYLTALITYYGFLSLFPLLLVGATVLGYVLQGHPQLQQDILGSALTQFPVIGDQLLHDVRGYTGSGPGLAVGLIGGLIGGLGVAQAAQNAMNQIYAVPRNERPNPLLARVRSLLLLLTLGIAVLLTTALSAFSAGGGLSFLHDVGPGLRLLSALLSVALNLLIFLVAYRVLTAQELSVRDVLIGAVAAAVCWQLLQAVGSLYVRHELKGASQVYGVFGVVLGLLAWIYLQALVVVLCAELNVVVRRHLWPRALLTPFTDAVQLTAADQRAYTSYAEAQRTKGFEHVDVDFDHPEDLDRR